MPYNSAMFQDRPVSAGGNRRDGERILKLNDYETRPGHGGLVIFEFVPLGAQVKVVAVDGATGDEVSIIGPIHAPRGDLERVALQKLEALKRRRAEKKTEPAPPPPPGRGRLV